MSSSPWGVIQGATQITRGVRNVSTAGHGGIMVTKKYAEKNFSKGAITRALEYGSYYCFEEDCDWAIPMWELKSHWEKIYGEGMEEAQKSIIKTLSLYNPDYLLEKGIQPVEPQYSRYKEWQLRYRMEIEKDPDLIVCAWGTWQTNIPGVIKVETADGKYYHIKEDGYKELFLKLLSKCKVIKEVDEAI